MTKQRSGISQGLKGEGNQEVSSLKLTIVLCNFFTADT